jgi:hypothetical protein
VTLTTQNTQSAFRAVQQKYVEADAFALVVDYEKKGFHPEDVKDWLKPEDLAVRMKLLDALEKYATQLADISGDTPPLAVDAAAKELGVSLTTLAQTEPLRRMAKNAPMEAVNTAFDALAHFLIEEKRNKDLPRLVAEMQKPVDTVADLLVKDLGTRESGGLRDELWKTYDRMLITQNTYIHQHRAQFTPGDLASQIERLPALVREQREADQTLEQTQRALRQLVTTHAELEKAVREKRDLHSEVYALVREGERIKDFYTSLATAKR